MTAYDRARARLHHFLTAEHGGVTVDWIALTAALVFMGIGATFYIASSVPQVADQVSSYMSDFKFED